MSSQRFEVELDKRVGEYAAAIVRDADLLLEDAVNLNDQQQQFINNIKRSMIHFMSFYNEYLSMFSESVIERQTLSFEFRTPVTSIAGFCDLLTLEVVGTLNELQHQRVQQIKVAQEFISSAFNIWMNEGQNAQY